MAQTSCFNGQDPKEAGAPQGGPSDPGGHQSGRGQGQLAGVPQQDARQVVVGSHQQRIQVCVCVCVTHPVGWVFTWPETKSGRIIY